jgi:hypothetical protein
VRANFISSLDQHQRCEQARFARVRTVRDPRAARLAYVPRCIPAAKRVNAGGDRIRYACSEDLGAIDREGWVRPSSLGCRATLGAHSKNEVFAADSLTPVQREALQILRMLICRGAWRLSHVLNGPLMNGESRRMLSSARRSRLLQWDMPDRSTPP